MHATPVMKPVWIKALLDTGAIENFINKKFAEQVSCILEHLPADKVGNTYNTDGTINQNGPVTHCTKFVINFMGHYEVIQANVVNLGANNLIIGYPWFRHHNPTIDF